MFSTTILVSFFIHLFYSPLVFSFFSFLVFLLADSYVLLLSVSDFSLGFSLLIMLSSLLFVSDLSRRYLRESSPSCLAV